MDHSTPSTIRNAPHRDHDRRNPIVLRIGIIAGMVICGGCATPQRIYRPALDPAGMTDIVFLHYLATVPVVSTDEGMRAVLMLFGATPKPATFDHYYRLLHQIDAVKDAWRMKSGQQLDKGTLAYMLASACRLPWSLSETLAYWTNLGDRRYALTTCVHSGLMLDGAAHQAVSGGELLSTLKQAERLTTPNTGNNP